MKVPGPGLVVHPVVCRNLEGRVRCGRLGKPGVDPREMGPRVRRLGGHMCVGFSVVRAWKQPGSGARPEHVGGDSPEPLSIGPGPKRFRGPIPSPERSQGDTRFVRRRVPNVAVDPLATLARPSHGTVALTDPGLRLIIEVSKASPLRRTRAYSPGVSLGSP